VLATGAKRICLTQTLFAAVTEKKFTHQKHLGVPDTRRWSQKLKTYKKRAPFEHCRDTILVCIDLASHRVPAVENQKTG